MAPDFANGCCRARRAVHQCAVRARVAGRRATRSSSADWHRKWHREGACADGCLVPRGFMWRGIVFSGRAKWQRSPGCPSAHWNAFADSASAPSSFALALARSDTSSLTSSCTSTLAALVRPHRSLRLPHDACLHPLGSRVRRSTPRRTPASARCEARGRRLTAYGSSTRRPPPRSRPLPDRRCLAPPASF